MGRFGKFYESREGESRDIIYQKVLFWFCEGRDVLWTEDVVRQSLIYSGVRERARNRYQNDQRSGPVTVAEVKWPWCGRLWRYDRNRGGVELR